MKRKNDIIKLRNEGKSYKEIVKILGCSSATVCYHLGSGQKDKVYQRNKAIRLAKHPFSIKIEAFERLIPVGSKLDSILELRKILASKLYNFNKGSNMKIQLEDVIKKLGDNPVCYLTGQQIDINKPSTYEFDHITPRIKGGDNSIDNLGICTKLANRSKWNMTPDEFLELCKQVVIKNGYKLSRED